jgi:hypothetical protein
MKKGYSENIKIRLLNNILDNIKPRVTLPQNTLDPLYYLSLIVLDYRSLIYPLALFSPYYYLIKTVGIDKLI